MNVVLLLWRARLRASCRSALILVVLIGLGGAVTLAVTAGARRTASAHDAILEAGNASEVTATVFASDPAQVMDDLRAIPAVAGAELFIGFRGTVQGGEAGSIDTVFGFSTDAPQIDRPFLTSGRFPTGPSEGMLTEQAARRSGLGVGSKVQVTLADASFSDFRTIDVDVVGVALFQGEVIVDELSPGSLLFLSQALTTQHLDLQTFSIALLTLTSNDIDAVKAPLASLGQRTVGEDYYIDEFRDEDRGRVQRALRPLLFALTGLAALAAGVTVLVAAQALSRMVRRRRLDDRSLATLGCTTRQLVAVDLAFAASVAAPGIAVAVALAVAASPLFPVGPPRRIDAIGGVDVDVAALGVGALVLVGAMLFGVGAGSWRRRTRREEPTLGRAPGLLGARPASSAGVRLVTGRRGTVSTMTGAAVGLAAVIATLTFTASLDHLVEDPALVGMGWDVVAREGYTTVDVAAVLATAEGGPPMRRLSALSYLDGEVDGVKVPLAEVRSLRGDPWPPIVGGRAPRSPSEMLVGRATMRRLHLDVGDEVDVSISSSFNDVEEGSRPGPGVRRFTVVGSAISPAIGLGGFDSPRLDVGALVPEGAYQDVFGQPVGADVVLFDLAEAGAARSMIDRFPEGLPDQFSNPTEWFTSAVPAEVSQADAARRVIWLAVAALAVAVVAIIAHAILGFVRQRRRSYAVLKALGFTRGQIRSTVLWQSGTVLAVAVVVAVAPGAAAGRWLWTGFAERIGVVSEPAVPLLLLGGAAGLAILAVQGTALIPASIARRTPAGQTLHGE